uniref:PAS domain S-box protein n=1 Tax=Chryseobacterium endophyticum TaxID=1854762 RepID=A0AAU6WJR5_9FLAO
MNSPDQIQAEELLSVLFHSPNATAIYKDEDVKIVSANKAMLKFWGKDREVIGKDFCSALPELHEQPFLKF